MSLKQDLNLNHLYIKQHYKYLTIASGQYIYIYMSGEKCWLLEQCLKCSNYMTYLLIKNNLKTKSQRETLFLKLLQ